MEGLRERVLELARAKGLTQADMEEAAGVAHSTYDGMWDRDTVSLGRLKGIAARLDMTVVELLTGETPADLSMAAEPLARYGKPYLEQRVETLEAELRKVREQVRHLIAQR